MDPFQGKKKKKKVFTKPEVNETINDWYWSTLRASMDEFGHESRWFVYLVEIGRLLQSPNTENHHVLSNWAEKEFSLYIQNSTSRRKRNEFLLSQFRKAHWKQHFQKLTKTT